jgi:hypothetical protein
MLHFAIVRCQMHLYTSDSELMAKRMELAGTYILLLQGVKHFISCPDISWSYSTTCCFHCFDAWHVHSCVLQSLSHHQHEDLEMVSLELITVAPRLVLWSTNYLVMVRN